MELKEREILMKAILDEQEKVRDFESHSKSVKDSEVSKVFKQLAEEHGHHARQLHELLERFE
jgi:rubrerythrin